MNGILLPSCILSKFYIKPQPLNRRPFSIIVVSYRNSTSNHNYRGKKRVIIALYLIEILHQTTTHVVDLLCEDRCILSKFYIKPQLCINTSVGYKVVSYRNSTSNHNRRSAKDGQLYVVSYRNSTSNHNVGPHID